MKGERGGERRGEKRRAREGCDGDVSVLTDRSNNYYSQ